MQVGAGGEHEQVRDVGVGKIELRTGSVGTPRMALLIKFLGGELESIGCECRVHLCWCGSESIDASISGQFGRESNFAREELLVTLGSLCNFQTDESGAHVIRMLHQKLFYNAPTGDRLALAQQEIVQLQKAETRETSGVSMSSLREQGLVASAAF